MYLQKPLVVIPGLAPALQFRLLSQLPDSVQFFSNEYLNIYTGLGLAAVLHERSLPK
jgi:hypothetical protein